MIQSNLERLSQRVENACRRSGRKKEEIQIVAVTKMVLLDKIAEAIRCGIHEIGESRVQETQDKFQSLHSSFPSVKWHLIGHLQRNKVNRAVEIFDCIQSVDSERLAEAIDRRASEIGKVQECLVEIKVSEEETKFGLDPDGLEKFLERAEKLKNLTVSGIMAIAPFFENPELARPYFRRAKEIFGKFFILRPMPYALHPILSMGMSHDFEIAIEEGCNMIRVGSAIFGERSVIGERLSVTNN